MADYINPVANDPALAMANDGPSNNHSRPLGGNGVGGTMAAPDNHDVGIPYTPLTVGPKTGVASEGMA